MDDAVSQTTARRTHTESAEKFLPAAVMVRAYAFDKRTGGVLWSIPFALVFSGQPVVKDGKVYLGSEDGTLLALDEASGTLLWRYRTKGAIHGPVAVTNDECLLWFGRRIRLRSEHR